MATIETTSKRTINFMFTQKTRKRKKVWDVLKSLWLIKKGTGKNTTSTDHDKILYT
jgi:hypothetical protein